jgi:hypothetical protein
MGLHPKSKQPSLLVYYRWKYFQRRASLSSMSALIGMWVTGIMSAELSSVTDRDDSSLVCVSFFPQKECCAFVSMKGMSDNVREEAPALLRAFEGCTLHQSIQLVADYFFFFL